MKQCIFGTQNAVQTICILLVLSYKEALLMKKKMIETNPQLDGFHASEG